MRGMEIKSLGFGDWISADSREVRKNGGLGSKLF